MIQKKTRLYYGDYGRRPVDTYKVGPIPVLFVPQDNGPPKLAAAPRLVLLLIAAALAYVVTALV